MGQKINIPKGLKKVECIKTTKMRFEEDNPDIKWEDRNWSHERFTLGKVYNCNVDKTGKTLIIKTDYGKKERASYLYFKPAEKIKQPKKPIKKIIANKLIKILKKI